MSTPNDPRAVAEDAQAYLRAGRGFEAAAHGAGVLLVQAGKMSEPIFARLGFKPTAKLTMLRDKSSN